MEEERERHYKINQRNTGVDYSCERWGEGVRVKESKRERGGIEIGRDRRVIGAIGRKQL